MTPEEIEALKTENEANKAEAAKLKADIEAIKAAKEKKGDEDDLLSKAKKEKEITEKNSADAKKIESSIKFNLSVGDFVKTNKDILPGDIEGILKAAEKENYDTVSAKTNAVKVGMIGSFFSVQSNMDLLTQAQKNQLEDFQKLTKNGKEELAVHVYENIFEPAIEMLKKLKKAEEVGKSRNGFSTGSSVENDYKERLMKQARKGHLKDKE